MSEKLNKLQRWDASDDGVFMEDDGWLIEFDDVEQLVKELEAENAVLRATVEGKLTLELDEFEADLLIVSLASRIVENDDPFDCTSRSADLCAKENEFLRFTISRIRESR